MYIADFRLHAFEVFINAGKGDEKKPRGAAHRYFFNLFAIRPALILHNASKKIAARVTENPIAAICEPNVNLTT